MEGMGFVNCERIRGWEKWTKERKSENTGEIGRDIRRRRQIWSSTQWEKVQEIENWG